MVAHSEVHFDALLIVVRQMACHIYIRTDEMGKRVGSVRVSCRIGQIECILCPCATEPRTQMRLSTDGNVRNLAANAHAFRHYYFAWKILTDHSVLDGVYIDGCISIRERVHFFVINAHAIDGSPFFMVIYYYMEKVSDCVVSDVMLSLSLLLLLLLPLSESDEEAEDQSDEVESE